MYAHVLDHKGTTVFEKDLPAEPEVFLDAMTPFRDGLVVGAECMFAWYWLANLCEDHQIPFVLGHALYMRMIHGGKAKTDRIDAAKLATLCSARGPGGTTLTRGRFSGPSGALPGRSGGPSAWDGTAPIEWDPRSYGVPSKGLQCPPSGRGRFR
jgi:hypothetical protein